MIVKFYAKNIYLRERLKKYIEDKLNKLSRYQSLDIRLAKVNLTMSQHHRKGDVYTINVKLVHAQGNIQAEERADDMFAAVDVVQDKLERLIRKEKTKYHSRRRKMFNALRAIKRGVWRR